MKISFQPYFALFILLLAYILSFIDRNIMSILAGPIQQDLGISDFQFGLLQGLFFTLFYSFLGLPIARVADQGNRKNLITLGVTFWSLMTACCGMTKHFILLSFARMGVGLGEAALSPAAHSLLSDLFSARRLPLALAIFSLGITVGGGIAYILGAWLHTLAEQGVFSHWFLFDSLASWQITFILVGLPGFIVALLCLLIHEPKRKGVSHTNDKRFFPAWYFCLQHQSIYLYIIIAISLLSILGYGFMSWFPEYLIRRFALTRSEVGVKFGTLFMVFGSMGTIIGALFSSYLTRFGYQDGNIRLIIWAAFGWLLVGVPCVLVPSADWALFFACAVIFILNCYFAVAIAGLHIVSPNQYRAQISALTILGANLFGMGLGPATIGFLSSRFFTHTAGLGDAMACLIVIISPIVIMLVYRSLQPYRELLLKRSLR